MYLYRPGPVDRSLRAFARTAAYSACPDGRLFPAGHCRASGIGFAGRGAQLSERRLCDRSTEQSQLAPFVFAKSNLNTEVMFMERRKVVIPASDWLVYACCSGTFVCKVRHSNDPYRKIIGQHSRNITSEKCLPKPASGRE